MSDKKQYFRKLNPGDVNVEGRQSNGFTADKKGNVIFYSGLKDSELDYLAEIQNKDDIPLYYGNSYFGVIKSETHNTLNLGNDNYETLNEKVDANKIITNVNTAPPKIKAILIGDSQTPFVDKNSTQSSRISTTGGESSLWLGGQGVRWLIDALTKYSGDPDVTHVITVIGTNGGFGKFAKDDIPKLFSLIKSKFPKAIILTVQGSWGWGGLKDITEQEVRNYYKQYEKQGAILVEPPIGNIEPHGDYPVYKLIGKKIDEIILNNVVAPSKQQTPPTSPPVKENTPPPPAPQIDQYEIESEFIYLEDESPELSPTQLTGYIVPAVVVPTTEPPEDLIEPPGKETEYNGPKNPTERKGNNEVLRQEILKGRDGDVKQEIHLPHPSKKGKEITDGYRGLIPVKQVTFNANLISFADIIATFKRLGLTEKQARSCFALTGAEAARRGKSGYFSGYNWNIFGLQAEGKWRESVSKYISYRYIARDSLDNINTGETTSLRIFAGYVNIDAAVSSKVEAMRFKGLLDATSPDDWAKKYRCTWVASGCDDAASLANAKAIYNTWGVKFFDQYKGKIY